MDAFFQIFDMTLLATVGLIFAATLVGAYVRSRRRDICLKSFEGFHVTLERTDNKIIWGVLELESTGLELHYRNSIQDDSHVESSYVLYGSEYGDVQAVYRYVDDLSDEDRRRRQKDLDRSFHPGPILLLLRNIQHFFELANESMSEVFGLIVGRLRKPAGRYITEQGEEHLKRFGTTIFGSGGGDYDPLLERFVGRKVVVDVIESEEVHEHIGIFKDYSPDFITLLDVQFPERQSIELTATGEIADESLSINTAGGVIRVKNRTEQPLLLQSLRLEGADGQTEDEMLNVVVGAAEIVELHPESPFGRAELNVRVVRELDMIVPRTRCMVRHRAERYAPEILPEIIFDLGIMLRGNSVADAREARLRKQIDANPLAALAMCNLGALLMQKQIYAEAELWLQKAYEMRNSLPDNGRRTLMLLHELWRKLGKDQRKSRQVRLGQIAGTPPSVVVADGLALSNVGTVASIASLPDIVGGESSIGDGALLH
jgi:hypothetical protein